MIVLKNLANEFNIDPYKLRQRLREKFGLRRRWRWDPSIPQDQRDLAKIKKFLATPKVPD